MSAILWWPEIYRAFDLSVPVKIGAGVSGSVSGPTAFGLEVPVGVGMSAAAVSSGEFDLAVPISLGMRGPASTDLSVPVSIGMAGAEQYSAVTDLSVPVSIGVTGQFFSGALDLAVPVSFGMAGTPSVAFDAARTGSYGTGASPSFSWAHTASGPDIAVVVTLVVRTAIYPASSITVTYGGYSMNPLSARAFNSTGASEGQSRTQQFVLLNAPAGQQAVEVKTYSAGSIYIAANSMSYNHVGSYNHGGSSAGSGTSRSLTVAASRMGDMVVQAFGQDSPDAMSNYNRTQRGTIANQARVLVGDAAGTGGNVSFTATGPNAPWSAVSVILRPE